MSPLPAGSCKAMAFVEAALAKSVELKVKDVSGLVTRASVTMDFSADPANRAAMVSSQAGDDADFPLVEEVFESLATAPVSVNRGQRGHLENSPSCSYNVCDILDQARRNIDAKVEAARAAGKFTESETEHPAGGAAALFISYEPSLEDYPDYKRFLDSRDQLLACLPEEDRGLFSVEMLKPHSEVRRNRACLAHIGFHRRLGSPSVLEALARLGPHSLYPTLDGVPSWNYKRYAQCVLGSEAGASVPCLHGRLPLSYVAAEGSLAEFSRVLDLCPEAVHIVDQEGLSVLWFTVGAPNGAQKARIALDRGADPNAISISGRSLFCSSLQYGSMGVGVALMEHGYRPERDPCLDQTQIDKALDQRQIPPELSQFLRRVRPAVPERSPFTVMVTALAQMPFVEIQQAKAEYEAAYFARLLSAAD